MTKPLDQPRPTLRASVVAVPPRHRFTACIGRLSAAVGTGRARCLWKAAAVCWAEVLPVIAADAGRALGPMLPSSARERWPFCVLRDSCHAALLDQPGLPSNGSGRWTGGSRRRPRARRLTTDYHCFNTVGVRLCYVGSPLSDREKVVQTRLVSLLTQNGAVRSCPCSVLRVQLKC